MTSTKTKINEALRVIGLAVTAEFIPLSKTSNKDEWRSLNWNVTLLRNGREVLTTQYSAGIAHCPSYNSKVPSNWNRPDRMWQDAVCEFECEAGFKAAPFTTWGGFRPDKTKPILPDPADVVYSLIRDAEVLDYATFEEWADNFGYGTDSRKAEQIYRACLEIALKLRAGLGDACMRELAELFEDY